MAVNITEPGTYINHHFKERDSSTTYIKRCMQTKMNAGMSRQRSYSICMQEYKIKKQKKHNEN